jgi:hypothetical protein
LSRRDPCHARISCRRSWAAWAGPAAWAASRDTPVVRGRQAGPRGRRGRRG